MLKEVAVVERHLTLLAHKAVGMPLGVHAKNKMSTVGVLSQRYLCTYLEMYPSAIGLQQPAHFGANMPK